MDSEGSTTPFPMTKIRKIKLPGCPTARDVGCPLKLHRNLPIRTAGTIVNTPWKEVRIMEVGGFEVKQFNYADQMKSIRKVRLQREVMENPELARQLVKVEASGTYNAKGDIIQTVGSIGEA